MLDQFHNITFIQEKSQTVIHVSEMQGLGPNISSRLRGAKSD